MSDLRLSAYYYSFTPTGIPEIDNILSAVAWAGKSFHHTDGWTEETDAPEQCKGSTPEEWIQNAAIEAAKSMKQAAAEIRRQALEEAARACITLYEHNAAMWSIYELTEYQQGFEEAATLCADKIRALAQPNGAEGER